MPIWRSGNRWVKPLYFYYKFTQFLIDWHQNLVLPYLTASSRVRLDLLAMGARRRLPVPRGFIANETPPFPVPRGLFVNRNQNSLQNVRRAHFRPPLEPDLTSASLAQASVANLGEIFPGRAGPFLFQFQSGGLGQECFQTKPLWSEFFIFMLFMS